MQSPTVSRHPKRILTTLDRISVCPRTRHRRLGINGGDGQFNSPSNESQSSAPVISWTVLTVAAGVSHWSERGPGANQSAIVFRPNLRRSKNPEVSHGVMDKPAQAGVADAF